MAAPILEFVLEKSSFPHEIGLDQMFNAAWVFVNRGGSGQAALYATPYTGTDNPILNTLSSSVLIWQGNINAGEEKSVPTRTALYQYFSGAIAGHSYAIRWAVGTPENMQSYWDTFTYVKPWSGAAPGVHRLVEVEVPAQANYVSARVPWSSFLETVPDTYRNIGATSRITDSFSGGFDVPASLVSENIRDLPGGVFEANLVIGFPLLAEYQRVIYDMLIYLEVKVDNDYWRYVYSEPLRYPVAGGKIIPFAKTLLAGKHTIHFKLSFYLADRAFADTAFNPEHNIWIFDYVSYDVNVAGGSVPPPPPPPPSELPNPKFVYTQCDASADQVGPNEIFTINLQLKNAGKAGDVYVGYILGTTVPWKVLSVVHMGAAGSDQDSILIPVRSTAAQLAKKTFVRSEYIRPGFFTGPVVSGKDINKYDPSNVTDFWEPPGSTGFGIAVVVTETTPEESNKKPLLILGGIILAVAALVSLKEGD